MYKEVLDSGIAINENMLESAFEAISRKKEEIYSVDIKKMTNKDKNNIIKILEDIKLNGWKISQQLMNRFNELSK